MLLPIIPLWWPKFYPLHLKVTVASPDDVTMIQFNDAEIRFTGNTICPRAVYLYDHQSKERYFYDYTSIKEYYHGRLARPEDFILSAENKMYDLDFFKIPSRVEKFTINLGHMKINGKEIPLPPVK